MDVARLLISKAIATGDIEKAIAAGISPDWFDDPQQRRVWKWMVEYFERYQTAPTEAALDAEFPVFKLLQAPEPYEYYVDRFRLQRRRAIVTDAILDADDALRDDEPSRALAALEPAIIKARSLQNGVGLTTVVASSITPKRVTWLWYGRIPKGKLVVVAGDAGLGKTTAVIDWIARLTTGRPLPGTKQARDPMTCLIMSAEDDMEDTLTPRLIAAGADCNRVHFVTGTPSALGEVLPTFPDDIDRLKANIQETKAALVLVDPFNAFLNGRIDSYKDSDIRRAFAPLARIASETGATILLIFHLNKSSGPSALHRIVGSVGIGAAPRSVLVVAKSPDDADERILAVAKVSNAPVPPSIAFRIQGTQPFGAARAVWAGPVDYSADDIVRPTGPDHHSALTSAIERLKELLMEAAGKMEALKVMAQMEVENYSASTIRRAKVALGVESVRHSDVWYWRLPSGK